MSAATGQSAEAERRVALGFVLLGCVLAGSSFWMCREYIVDDALISLRYANNFLRGSGLVFNPGEYVEGFTNLGQVLGVIALGSAGVDLVTASRVLGIAGGIAAVVFGPAAVMPDAHEQALERAVARLLCLANFFFVYLAISGMETGLYVGLTCLAFHTLKRSGDRMGWATGALAGSLFVVRPDGLLFGIALVCLAAGAHGVRRLIAMPGTWLWLAILAAIEAWRFSYYGAWVPNTARIKGAGSTELFGSMPWYGMVGDDVVEMFAQSGGVLAVLFAMIAIVRHPRRDRVLLAVVACATTLAFAVYAGGDWMLGYRFLLPLLPFYLSLVAIGLVDVQRTLQRTAPNRLLLPGFAAAIAVVAVYCWSFGLEFRFHRDQYPNTHMTSEYMVPAARWIAESFPASYQVTAGAIGSLGYYTDLAVIDTVGLTDATIAGFGSNRAAKDAYIAQRNPELVLRNAALVPPAEREIYGRSYRFARFFRRGIERPWALYVRADLPLAAGESGKSPAGTDAFRRLSPLDDIPQSLVEPRAGRRR